MHDNREIREKKSLISFYLIEIIENAEFNLWFTLDTKTRLLRNVLDAHMIQH